jgi:hypothetical protein
MKNLAIGESVVIAKVNDKQLALHTAFMNEIAKALHQFEKEATKLGVSAHAASGVHRIRDDINDWIIDNKAFEQMNNELGD